MRSEHWLAAVLVEFAAAHEVMIGPVAVVKDDIDSCSVYICTPVYWT